MTSALKSAGAAPDSGRAILFATLLAIGLAWAPAAALAQSDERQEPGNALDEYLEQAELALRDSRYREAAEGYVAAAKLSDEPEIAQTATRIAYTYGFNELALDAAKRWREVAPDDDEGMLYLAQLYLRLGDVRRADRYFSRLIRATDGEVDTRLLSLIPILSEEDEEDAFKLMKRLARPFRRSASAHYAVAVMALRAGDADEAQDRSGRAIELAPEWLRPKLVYARSLMLAGDDDAAIDFAARVVGDDPQPDPEARLELAVMYLSAGRDDDALSQVNQVLLEQPTRPDALRMLAIINFRLDNLDASWADFQDLLATGRYTMDALFYMARIADIREETERAIGLYTQVTSGQNVVPAQRRAGALMAKEEDVETALEHLDGFAESHPAYAIEMVVAQAQLLVSHDRYDEALTLFDKMTRFRPDDEAVMLGRADLLLRMDRVDDAVVQFEKAVDTYPNSANSLNALGYTLADRTRRHQEAYRLIRRALNLEPDSPAIIDSWGWVLYKVGRPNDALRELRRAYREFPDGEVAAHLVEVLWKLDETEEALELLESAERDSPGHPLLLDIRKRAFPDTVESSE